MKISMVGGEGRSGETTAWEVKGIIANVAGITADGTGGKDNLV
ncbi:MAG: hypothetical protein WCA35_15355 [Kovacikia sp.]